MRQFKWLFNVAKPYGWALSGIMFCHVLLTGCAVGFVYVSKRLVDIAVDLLRKGVPDGDGQLLVWAGAMVGIVILRICLNALRSYLQTKTEAKIRNSLRSMMFYRLLHLQFDGEGKRHSGDLLNRVLEDVRVVSSTVAGSIPNVVGAGLQFLAALCFLIWIDLRLALVIVAVVPFGVLGGRFIAGRVRRLTRDIRDNDSKVQVHLQESVQHLTVLQTMEYTDASASSLDGLQNSLYSSVIRRVKFSLLSRMAVSLALSAGHTVAFIWGVYGISRGTVTYGMMTAFLQLVGQIQRPLMELSHNMPAIIHSMASVDRILEIEDMPSEDSGTSVLLEAPAGVRLENITFGYPGSASDIFSSFSYDFRPGSRTAVVGPTGVGKSTFVRLLLSLVKPSEGVVSLYSSTHPEGVEASAATRVNLVYVPQGNSLFSGTIRDNLLVGNPGADDAAMVTALHTAAADFVMELPAGLDTQCFEKGGGLSEGQAQRIAIARALLRPGSLLVFDEFSSALDSQTEDMLMERLTASSCDRTMIFITHKEHVLSFCDTVLKL